MHGASVHGRSGGGAAHLSARGWNMMSTLGTTVSLPEARLGAGGAQSRWPAAHTECAVAVMLGVCAAVYGDGHACVCQPMLPARTWQLMPSLPGVHSNIAAPLYVHTLQGSSRGSSQSHFTNSRHTA